MPRGRRQLRWRHPGTPLLVLPTKTIAAALPRREGERVGDLKYLKIKTHVFTHIFSLNHNCTFFPYLQLYIFEMLLFQVCSPLLQNKTLHRPSSLLSPQKPSPHPCLCSILRRREGRGERKKGIKFKGVEFQTGGGDRMWHCGLTLAPALMGYSRYSSSTRYLLGYTLWIDTLLKHI